GTDGSGDNIVWGTEGGDNIVWGTVADGDNIVWGTDSGDNIVWGTDSGDNIVWGTVDSSVFSWVATDQGTPMLVGDIDGLTDAQIFAVLSHGPVATTPPPIGEPLDPPIPPQPEDPATT